MVREDSVNEELAAEAGRVLGVDLPFQQVTASEFMDIIGLSESHTTLRRHFESVEIDQQEGRIAGLDDIGTKIIGGPLTTVGGFYRRQSAPFPSVGIETAQPFAFGADGQYQ